MLLLVLAGGFGTRLREAVPDVPKPLAPVRGKPYLWYFLNFWISRGITSFVFSLHYKSEQILKFVEFEKRHGILKNIECQFLIEKAPLGTGGAVTLAVHELKLKKEFFVANADTWIGIEMSHLTEVVGNSMFVVEAEDTERFGTVNIEDGFVTSFYPRGSNSQKGWINAGIYKFIPDTFAKVNVAPSSLETYFLQTLVEQRKLRAVQIQGDFIDIGIPSDYMKFCSWVETRGNDFYAT